MALVLRLRVPGARDLGRVDHRNALLSRFTIASRVQRCVGGAHEMNVYCLRRTICGDAASQLSIRVLGR
jgi:hypothetical protein